MEKYGEFLEMRVRTKDTLKSMKQKQVKYILLHICNYSLLRPMALIIYGTLKETFKTLFKITIKS